MSETERTEGGTGFRPDDEDAREAVVSATGGGRMFHLVVDDQAVGTADVVKAADLDPLGAVVVTRPGVDPQPGITLREVRGRPDPRLRLHVPRPELRPTRAHPGDSGMDLRADLRDRDGSTLDRRVIMWPRRHAALNTGVWASVEPGFEIQVRLRSSSARRGLVLTNAPGTVDSGYRGEIVLLLYNAGDAEVVIEDGDRVAQMVVCPVSLAAPEWVDSVGALGETSRGDGMMGSTGVR